MIFKNIIETFITHRVAANLLMALLCLMGVASLHKINTQFFPNIDLDLINVHVSWPGANAEDIEQGITIPLETELQSVDHLDTMTSSSKLGVVDISLQFKQGTHIEQALENVKQRVNQVRTLPAHAEKPVIEKSVFYELISKLIILSPATIESLRPTIKQIERDLLDSGIAKINIVGLPKLVLSIKVSAKTLERLHIDLTTITKLISEKSIDLPLGNIGDSSNRQQFRSINQRRTINEFKNMPIITTPSHQLLRLGDIATIELEPKQQEIAITYQGHPAVELELFRSQSSNTLKNAKTLQDWLATKAKTYGHDLKITPYYESWIQLNERISLLINNGISGFFLIAIVLFIFLRGKVALWVSSGIFVSLLCAVTLLYLLDGTINMISLFAFILTLGIVVDDAIVVSEEALTQFSHTPDALKAVTRSTSAMFAPVAASSLTTISAFLPLFMIGGIVGSVLKDIPLVVICVLISSFVECFLILPNHLLHSFKNLSLEKKSQWRESVDNAVGHFRENIFRPLVTKAVNHCGFTIALAAALIIFAVSLVMTRHLHFSFFPTPPGRIMMANIQFIAGTPEKQVNAFLAELDRALRKTESQLKQGSEPLVTTAIWRNKISGFNAKDINRGNEFASILVELNSPDHREATNEIFRQTWLKNITLPEFVENFTINQPRSGPPGKDIDIELSHAPVNELKKAALEIEKALRSFDAVNNISDDLPFGQEQLTFNINPHGLGLGLTPQNVGSQLNAAYAGDLAQIFYSEQSEVEVRTILPDLERFHKSALSRLPIRTPAGEMVPFNTIATLDYRKGFDVLRHTNSHPTVHVTGDVDTFLGNSNEIQATLSTQILPPLLAKYGIKASLVGQAKEQMETMADIKSGLVIGLILIYIILAWVFASYAWPLLILIAIPFGLTGALIGHWLMGLDITMISFFGFFGLSGIVINDSIILLATYREFSQNGQTRTVAIANAACARLRPVLLTSITTIAGLTPLLFERSLQAQFLIPMATSICFGLVTSTALILLVMPAILAKYEFIQRETKRFFRMMNHKLR